MLRHLVVWEFKDGYSYEEKRKLAQKIKEDLEGLQGVVPEIKSIKVHTNLLPTSSFDILLDSRFESVEALALYQKNPEHKRVGNYIAEVTMNRNCVDYYND